MVKRVLPLMNRTKYNTAQVIGPPLNRCLLLVGADCLSWLQVIKVGVEVGVGLGLIMLGVIGYDPLSLLQELPRTNLPSVTGPAQAAGQVISNTNTNTNANTNTNTNTNTKPNTQVISSYFVARRCAACSSPAVKPLCTGRTKVRVRTWDIVCA